MPPKERDRNFRRAAMVRDKAKRNRPGKGPRTPKNEAYKANKRVSERATLREMRWEW